MTPIGLLFLAVMFALIWFLPRQKALMRLMIMTCYTTLGQAVIVGKLHFQFFRTLLVRSDQSDVVLVLGGPGDIGAAAPDSTRKSPARGADDGGCWILT